MSSYSTEKVEELVEAHCEIVDFGDESSAVVGQESRAKIRAGLAGLI